MSREIDEMWSRLASKVSKPAILGAPTAALDGWRTPGAYRTPAASRATPRAPVSQAEIDAMYRGFAAKPNGTRA